MLYNEIPDECSGINISVYERQNMSIISLNEKCYNFLRDSVNLMKNGKFFFSISRDKISSQVQRIILPLLKVLPFLAFMNEYSKDNYKVSRNGKVFLILKEKMLPSFPLLCSLPQKIT